MKTETTKTLEIHTTARVYRVTIPSDAKVTFGPLVPASGKYSSHTEQGGTALRIYNGKENQMAVFRNVISFHDTSLPIDELIVEVNGKSEFVNANNHSSNKAETNRTERWVRLHESK